MKKSYILCAAAAAFVLFLSLSPSVYADRGMMMVSADPDVVLSEGVQRAVIAFNGTEEILILATEISASTTGTVLEFLPLPSAPVIEEASPEIFDRAMHLIETHAPTTSEGRGKRNGETEHATFPGIEVVGKTTIGPHDITVVKIESTEHFTAWVGDFMSRQGIAAVPATISEMKRLVAGYLERDIPYFVFDAVSVETGPTGVVPLLYRFSTDRLYYPLEISSGTSGQTEIDLVLVAPGVPKKGALPKGFSVPEYVIPMDPFGGKKDDAPSISVGPVSFPLGMTDRVTLSPAVAALMTGYNTKVALTVLRYRGEAADLSGDLLLDTSDFSVADFDGIENAVKSAKDLAPWAPEGTVDRAVEPPAGGPQPTATADGVFTSFLPGNTPFEVKRVDLAAAYTAPAAADGDIFTPFILESDRSWTIDLGSAETIETVDLLAAVPIPDRDTTYTYGIRLLISDTGKFAGEQKMAGSGLIESYTRTDEGDDVSNHAVLVRLTKRPITARYLRIEYIPYGAYNDIYLFEVMPWGKTQ